MPLGDDLFGGTTIFEGPQVFTPEMAGAGIRLIPSAPTLEAAKISPRGTVQNPSRRGVLGSPIFRPEDLRPVSPYDPTQRVAPEDDALTPPGMLAPSELKQTGSFFSKLGDIFENPASQKFLASIGASISPGGLNEAGQFAIDAAESEAQRRFRQGLEGGENAGDILTPGLSAVGREEVLDSFRGEEQAAFARNRALEEIGLTKELRDIQRGQGQLDRDREGRLNEQGNRELDLRQESNRIDAVASNSLAKLRDMQVRQIEAELAGGTFDPKALNDLVLRTNQTAEAFQKRIVVEEGRLAKAEADYQRAKDAAPGALARLKPGDQGGPYQQSVLNPLAEEIQKIERNITALQNGADQLTQAASDALLGTATEKGAEGAREQGIVTVGTEEEALALPPGTRVRLNGKIFTIEE